MSTFHLPKIHVAMAAMGFLLIASGVIWVARGDIADFQEGHRRAIENEAASAQVSIEQFVADRLRFIEAFALEREDLLARIFEDPENEELRKEIDESLRRWFPTYFTFTLADKMGNDLISDIDELVGAICVASIERFLGHKSASDGHLYEPEIHPQPHNYHFDMMSPWYRKGDLKGVFFVSFYPDIVQRLLESYESTGHRLMVVHRDRDGLIEVTSAGARDKIGATREVFLTETERANVMVKKIVANARWDVVGLRAPGLFEEFARQRWAIAGLLIIAVGMAGGMALITLGRAEGQGLAAQRETEDANERLKKEIGIKDRFFSIIGHDLRSPFTTLLGLSDVMVRMSDELTREQMVDYANEINLSGKRVYELLDNLLEWARLQMEKGEINPERYPLQATFEKTDIVLGDIAAEKGLTLACEPTDFEVVADPNMVLLLVRNLVANAIKFTETGGRITISARGDGDAVEIAVEDTGTGIDPAIAGNLFAVDTKTTTLGTDGEIGTGLGLPLCKELIEANGGRIWFETEPGRGTSFRFTVPAPS